MDVELIITKLEQLNLLRPNKIIGDWYSVYCPFHSGGRERRPSCGVLLHSQYKNGNLYSEGMFHCFACGYSKDIVGAVSDILRNNNISISGYDWLSENIPGFSEEFQADTLLPKGLLDDVNQSFALNYVRSASNENHTTEYISESELASYRYTVPYMYERKLTDELIEKYDIGVDLNWIPPGRKNPVPCITFPVRDSSFRTLFLCRRSIQGKIYNYPQGVTKPLYGIENIPKNCKSLVIVESCINALTCVRYGYPAVALLGTGNSYQIGQLRQLGVSEFVLAFDGDDAGRRAAIKMKKALKDIAIIWTIDMPDGKDVNDCTEAEFNELYMNRR